MFSTNFDRAEPTSSDLNDELDRGGFYRGLHGVDPRVHGASARRVSGRKCFKNEFVNEFYFSSGEETAKYYA